MAHNDTSIQIWVGFQPHGGMADLQAVMHLFSAFDD